jgi:hypothetical protein
LVRLLHRTDAQVAGLLVPGRLLFLFWLHSAAC